MIPLGFALLSARKINNMKKKGKALLALWLCVIIAVPALFKAAAFEVRDEAPKTSNSYYYSSANPYYPGFIGQCTWYAYGRACEIRAERGESAPTRIPGDAGEWWQKNINNGYYSYGQTPSLGAWACYSGGPEGWGHVAVVERIDGSGVYVSESNYAESFNYNREIHEEINQTFLGYIYVCGKPSSSTTAPSTEPATEPADETTAPTEAPTVLQKYTVSFDANGGDGAPAAQTKTHGTPLVLTAQTPTRNGYAFSGWAESANASRAAYKAGSELRRDADTTLYAVWEELIITGIALNTEKVYLSVGATYQLVCSLTPAGAAQTVSWESTNPEAATVNENGLVTGVGNAKTVIIARAGGYIAKCTVEVNSGVRLESIQLSDSSVSLAQGKTQKLYHSVLPSNATGVDLVWSSSNSAVATVSSSGVVTAVSRGSCTIYCEDEETGISAACTVNVTRSWSEFFWEALTAFASMMIKILDAFAGLV